MERRTVNAEHVDAWVRVCGVYIHDKIRRGVHDTHWSMTKAHAMSDAQSVVKLQHAWQISGAL
jgi:hypothetical protein